MSYIGLPPKATFSSGLLDRFTSTTGTTVTLTHDIASENDIVVFVNFVKQFNHLLIPLKLYLQEW